MTWVLLLWLGSSSPVVVQGFGSLEKCESFARKVNSPYYDESRKKYQCLKVEK